MSRQDPKYVKKVMSQKKTPKSKPIPKSLAFQRNTVGLSTEKKNSDLSGSISVPISSNWVAPAASNTINLIAQGTADNQRIGRKITMTSFQMRWSFGPLTTGGSPLRVLVVYDKQSNSALPATIEVLEQDDFHSPMSLGHADRYVILQSFITEPISLGNNLIVAGECYKKMGLDTMYGGTTAAITSVNTGSVFIMVCQQGGILTGTPLFKYYARIRYLDN